MTHLPSIISDLAFILIIAGIITIIFKWLNQPLVLGYIVAGFLTGPHSSFFPTVTDSENISIWAEIGVIFLLFGMGLEFSFKKLISNGKTGFITLIMIAIGLGVSGYFIGLWLGWGTWNSLILGCMLCLSSTTIIVKGFEDPRYKGKRFTEVVFGILIFDDLFAILVMVFMGTIAVSRHFEGTEMLLSLGKLIFFMVVWVVCGIFLIPTFLKKAKKWLNDETLLIISLGLCLGMVVFATEVELSSALGAFIMGSILAETIKLEKIETLTKPIKDFFGAVFFVSVGMMMNPTVIQENFVSVIIITLAVLLGKIIFTAIGARLSGESMLVSIQSGFSMAQVGEFAFIVASSAIAYQLADNFIYPIIIAVSILTTFTTPYLMAASIPFYNWMMKTIPDSWRQKILEKDERLENPKNQSDWSVFLTNYISNVIVFISLCIGAIIVTSSFIAPFINEHIAEPWGNIICLVITFLAISPILKGLVYRGGQQPYLILKLWQRSVRNRIILSSLILLRFIIAFAFIYVLLLLFLTIPVWVSVLIAGVLIFLVIQSKHLLKLYWKIEYRFVVNFNQRILEERRRNSLKQNGGVVVYDLDNTNWIESNLYVGKFKLEPGSEYEHKMLKDTDFRQRYDLIIITVRRGEEDLYFPNGDFVLESGDLLLVAGNIMNIDRLMTMKNCITMFKSTLRTIHEFSKQQDNDPHSNIKCISLIVEENSVLNNKSLYESEMGKEKKCFVVGFESKGAVKINPPANTTFSTGDILWIIGDKQSIYGFVKENLHL